MKAQTATTENIKQQATPVIRCEFESVSLRHSKAVYLASKNASVHVEEAGETSQSQTDRQQA